MGFSRHIGESDCYWTSIELSPKSQCIHHSSPHRSLKCFLGTSRERVGTSRSYNGHTKDVKIFRRICTPRSSYMQWNEAKRGQPARELSSFNLLMRLVLLCKAAGETDTSLRLETARCNHPLTLRLVRYHIFQA